MTGGMLSPLIGKDRYFLFGERKGILNAGNIFINEGSAYPAVYPAFAFTGTISTFSSFSSLTVVARTLKRVPVISMS